LSRAPRLEKFSEVAHMLSDVRVSAAFKRLLRLPGASVVDVGFGAEG
jgi:hypothetical protein